MRPTNGRMRGNHSFGRTLAVGATVVAVAVILALVAGVARAEQSLAEIAADLPVARTLVVAGVVLVLAVAAIQVVDATVFGVRAAVRILVAAVMFVAAAITSAFSHEAPTGWSYPPLCCSNQDCRQADPREVRETPDGYLLVTTGEVVPYLNYRVKPSPDGLFHVCQQAGNFDSGRILCLFAPPRGM